MDASAVRRQERAARRAGRGATSVPARFMVARIALVVAVFSLVVFGILMIYSASSVTAMTDESTGYNAGYYATRQLAIALVGVIVAAVISHTDYHLWVDTLLPAL